MAVSYWSNNFDYMPDGSYRVFMGGRVEFSDNVSEELKERFMADLKRLREETAERNAKGIFTDSDYY